MVTSFAKTSSPLDILGVSFLRLPTVKPPLWNCVRGEWVESMTAYKSNLINAMGGMDDVVLLSATSAQQLIDCLPEGVIMDGASGSRKHGVFIGSKNPDGFIKKFLSGNKPISHGSILFSECHRGMYSMENLSYKVVNHLTTVGHGDGCGLISMSLFTQLLQEAGETDLTPRQIQIRWGDKEKGIIAKGTLLPVPDHLIKGEASIVFNDSMFKGKCPTLNRLQHSKQSYLGIIQYGKLSRFGLNHQVIANFRSKEAQEYLLSLAKGEMEYLLSIRSNPKLVVQKWLDSFLTEPQWEDPDSDDDDDVYESHDSCITASKYSELETHWRMAAIIKEDVHNQLLHHPKTCQYVNSIMRKMVVKTATGAGLKGIKANGLMAAPLPGLPDGVIISPSLTPGTHIMWRYPVRHHGDVKEVTVYYPTDLVQSIFHLNVGEYPYPFHEGTFYVSPDWFIKMGGDFDGDKAAFVHVLNPDSNPLIQEIRNWKPIADIPKPDDQPIPYSFEEAAIKSSENEIGIVVGMMSACRILNWDSEFSKLGEQIQVVVESFKRGTQPDEEYLTALGKRIGKALPKQCWLKYHKKADVFLDPDSNRTYWGMTQDTIGRIWNQTLTMWKHGYILADNNQGIINDDSDLNEVSGMGVSPFLPMYTGSFKYLFQDTELTDAQLKWARTEWKKHQAQVVPLIQEIKELEGDPDGFIPLPAQLLIKQKQASLKDIYQSFIDTIQGYRETRPPEAMYKMAAAMWIVTHYSEAPTNHQGEPVEFNEFRTNSSIFNAFHLEIIKMLETQHGSIFRLWTNRHNAPSDIERFNGGTFTANVLRRIITYQDPKTNKQKVERVLYLVDSVSEKWLGRITTTGLMSNTFIPAEGTKVVVKITSLMNGKGKLSAHQCEIQQDDLSF